MYITRHWSTYRRDQGELLEAPSRAPNSGILVLKELEPEGDDDACCWGGPCCMTVKSLPLPSNQILSVYDNYQEIMCKYLFIPVLDYPLSFHRYYIIVGDSTHQGKVLACSSEEDLSQSCFGPSIRDVDPKLFDHRDLYLQIEISKGTYDGTFCAKSIARDGFPPRILRDKGWTASVSEGPPLGEAQGVNETLRAQLPNFNFSMDNKQSNPVVVGKWYCPFMFIREEGRLKDQMRKTVFYKVTLEQSWREIYMVENHEEHNNGRDFVTVDTTIEKEVSFVIGKEALKDEGEADNGFVWFRVYNEDAKKEVKVGLSSAVVDNLRWVQREGGWISGDGGNAKVERVEKIEGSNGWSKFACYMLVERFVFRRSDGSVLMKCDFNHTHQIRCKWES